MGYADVVFAALAHGAALQLCNVLRFKLQLACDVLTGFRQLHLLFQPSLSWCLVAAATPLMAHVTNGDSQADWRASLHAVHHICQAV